MIYNSNYLYNNYIPKNTNKKAYQTQPYPYNQSPPSINPYNNTNSQYFNQNLGSTNRSNNNKQTIFSPHSQNSLKWRNIMKIDLPLLQNSRDLNLIQPNLDNIVFGNISEEDIQTIPDTNLVKYIQILQTTCDILLNEQQDLEGEMVKLENENIQIINDFKKKEKTANKNKDLICHLKREKQRDISVLDTYRNAIHNLKNGNTFNFKQIKTTTIKDININDKKEENKKGEFKCDYCPDKTFLTEFELKKHLSEIHGIDKLKNNPNQIYQIQNPLPPKVNINFPPNFYNNYNDNQNINNNEDLIRQMEDMQKKFQETMLQMQENRKKEEEMQNLKKFEQKNNNNQEILDRLEKTFKDTVNDFKLMMEQNKEKNEPNIIIQNTGPDDDYINWKKKEILRLSEELKEKQDEIDKLDENYEKQIKDYETNIRTIKLEIYNKKKYLEDEENNRPPNINSNIIIKQQIEYETKPVINKKEEEQKQKQKAYFNSGKLVSDHDDSDEELKNAKNVIEAYENEKDIINRLIKKKRVLTDISPSNTLNQNKFFNITQAQQKDIIPEVSPVLETSNNIDNTIISGGLRNVDNKNIKLDNYYKRYKKRDTDYIEEPDFNRYLIETLPKKFDLNPDVTQKANDSMIDNINKTGKEIFPKNLNMNPQIEENELKEENTDNLAMLVYSLTNNMEKRNIDNKGNQEDYYKSIKELLELDKMAEKAKEIYNKQKMGINLGDQNTKKTQVELDNNKNVEEINTNIDKNKKDENKNTGNIHEVKDDIIENVLNDIEQKEKFKNKKKQKNMNNNDNQQNYINNVNTNITELNKKPNLVVLETKNIEQNVDQNLKNQNLNNPNIPNITGNKVDDSNYSSAKLGEFNNNNNEINNNNNTNKIGDTNYSSSKMGEFNNYNQTNNNNKIGDTNYSSTKLGAFNNNNELNNANKVGDTNYSSAKGGEFHQNNEINNNNKVGDTNYNSAKGGEFNNTNEINNNNKIGDTNYSSAKGGEFINNNNKIGDTNYSNAKGGEFHNNNEINNNSNNNDVTYTLTQSNINNDQMNKNNNIQEDNNNTDNKDKTNPENKNSIAEDYEGEFDK